MNIFKGLTRGIGDQKKSQTTIVIRDNIKF